MTDVASRTGQGKLSRGLIVSTAIDVARDAGVFGMTMRAVAARHGVAAMSLYAYVTNKDDLLLAMVERLCGPRRAAELEYPPGVDPATEDLIRAQRYVAIAARLVPPFREPETVEPADQAPRAVIASGPRHDPVGREP